jgi:hypothetical protein
MFFKSRKPLVTFLSSLPLILLFLTVSCKSTKNVPVFSATGYHVNQEAAMLTDTLRGYVFFPGTRVLIRTIFDADTLSMEVRTRDTLSLASMLVNGVTIWLDPTSKQNQTYGIAFPAARSEMMRQLNEPTKKITHEEDSIPHPEVVSLAKWVEAIQKREVIVTDNKGTRFAEKHVASVELNEGYLIYNARIAFSQMDVSVLEQKTISIGILSEIHQAILLGQHGGGGVATRPNISDRNRQQQQPSQRTQPRPNRMAQIPVKGWILFNLHSETQPEKMETKKQV